MARTNSKIGNNDFLVTGIVHEDPDKQPREHKSILRLTVTCGHGLLELINGIHVDVLGSAHSELAVGVGEAYHFV
jgi:hypothetical protein